MFVGIVKEDTFAIFPGKIMKPFEKFSFFQQFLVNNDFLYK